MMLGVPCVPHSGNSLHVNHIAGQWAIGGRYSMVVDTEIRETIMPKGSTCGAGNWTGMPEMAKVELLGMPVSLHLATRHWTLNLSIPY
jgi:hypothetical protein